MEADVSDFLGIPFPTYEKCKSTFVYGAARCGAVIKPYPIEPRGFYGERLEIVSACIGPRDAKRALLLNLGMHGAEDIGALIGVLNLFEHIRLGRRPKMPKDIRLICIYPLNPFGASFKHRGNADNVDLSRNGVDFDELFSVVAKEAPWRICHPDYEARNHILNPAVLSDQQKIQISVVAFEFAGEKFLEYVARGDVSALLSGRAFVESRRYAWKKIKQIVARGQYKDPKGMFFGGFETAPELLIFCDIIQNEMPPKTEHLVAIDCHIGLGENGRSKIITEFERGTPSFERVLRWYGGNEQDIESSHDEYGVSTAVPGRGALEHVIEKEVRAIAPQCDTLAFCLEVGVPSSEAALAFALHEDNWLHNHGDPYSEIGERIRKKMSRRFYPNSAVWRKACQEAQLEIFLKTIRALSKRH